MPKQGKRGKSPHSGAHGVTRQIITARNKARKTTKRNKKFARLHDPKRVEQLKFARIERRNARKDERRKKEQAKAMNKPPAPDVRKESKQARVVRVDGHWMTDETAIKEFGKTQTYLDALPMYKTQHEATAQDLSHYATD